MEPAPRHRAIDAQRRAWLDELAEARRQLDEELALLQSAPYAPYRDDALS
jgi:hypothetical protein